MNEVLLLTGERGVGKTGVCQRVVREARERGLTCAGVVSQAAFEEGEKAGITLIDVATGQYRPLAVADDSEGEVRWGKYRFLPEALDWGVQILEAATPCDLLVVDELGPLELEAGQGLIVALDVLKTGGFSMALVVVRPELVEALKERLGGRVSQVLEVTLASREQLPLLIVDLLAQGGD
jgi:nucleoside-triphosphatase THEP1